MQPKFDKKFCFLKQFYLNWLPKILPIMTRRLAIGSQCVNKESLDVRSD